jgi:nitroimidazol reductase NimA-like FMN-containing flavoprotein (pyridoxamine 5'-phosphate oxidase superfamily)
MRRHDCECTDPKELDAVLARADWGTLGLVAADGRPVLVPLAGAGEKVATIAHNPQASFLVVEAYAQVPSYAFHPQDACPATQYFKSVLVKGRIDRVEDPDEKAQALEALMEKLQPEGGHEPITAGSPTYRGALPGVAVFALTCQERTGKFKLGKQLKPEARAEVERVLEARNGPDDRRTLEAMGGK